MIRKIIGYGILVGLFIGFHATLFLCGGWLLLAIFYGTAAGVAAFIALIKLAQYLIQG